MTETALRLTWRRARPLGLVLAALMVGPVACGDAPARDAPPRSDPATVAALDKALAGPQRSPESRARDPYRHPKETLEYFGLRSDMTVLEVWPGGGGWWTEILAPVLREKGHYIAAGLDPTASPEPGSVKAFASKIARDPEVYDRVRVTALQFPTALAPVAPNSVDLIVTFRNLHNWLAKEDAAPAMLAAMYAALKPGGILGIEDHRANPASPVDPSAKLGYVNEQYAIDLIKRAGFEYLGSSEINANPKDSKDYEQGVWTLPPTYRLGDKDRARYTAIGESDRFTLLFRKPHPAG
jgi:predicted methyltransferase